MKFKKYDKARMLKEKERVEFEGQMGSSLYFKVFSGEAEYPVVFRGPQKQWLCDCQYFVIKGKTCSHVLACKLILKETLKNNEAASPENKNHI